MTSISTITLQKFRIHNKALKILYTHQSIPEYHKKVPWEKQLPVGLCGT